MKIFHCGHCNQLVFFENTSCVHCEHTLAYLPDRGEMGTLSPDGGAPDRFRSLTPGTEGTAYKLCPNYSKENVCNWAVPADDPNPYCLSCRLTRTIPDASRLDLRGGWARLETAKRRLIYSLLSLKLPLATKIEDPERGLAFEFLAEPPPGTPNAAPVLTGHANGVITINVAEADDAERERRRNLFQEPYRTLLGHFRHEVGHYYWDLLIQNSHWLDEYRKLFGDEREDYGQALQRYHQQGAPADWGRSFVSAYATAHPWEDWAESWAHYLHITDTLETAVACGLALKPSRRDEPALMPDITIGGTRPAAFKTIIDRWFPLTYVLNNLNRGMGLQDPYPFVLSPPAVAKLQFVHEVVSAETSSRTPKAETPGILKKIVAPGLFQF